MLFSKYFFGKYVIFVVFRIKTCYNSGMKSVMDLHTHSLSSGHHTCDTVTDMAREAAKRGIEYLGITEHAPAMPGSCGRSYFTSCLYADKKLFGVNMLYGAELNVLSEDGKVDLEKSDCKHLCHRIVSLHKDCFKPKNEEINTNALINAMKSGMAHIIGHPDDPTFDINFHALTDAAKNYDVALEINAVSVAENGYRKRNIEGLTEMLLLCKRKGVFVTLGSDSHGKEHIGEFDNIYKVLSATEFPNELVLNFYPDKFFDFVKNR